MCRKCSPRFVAEIDCCKLAECKGGQLCRRYLDTAQNSVHKSMDIESVLTNVVLVVFQHFCVVLQECYIVCSMSFVW